MKHLRYLRYVLVHKWYVMLECWKHGLYWQGLVHDLSKFLPNEWDPYVERFYGEEQSDPIVRYMFSKAIFRHFSRNKHHWFYWLETDGPDEINAHIPAHEQPHKRIWKMLRKYVIEMICDWVGAQRATGYDGTVRDWYRDNRGRMILHEETRRLVEELLESWP